MSTSARSPKEHSTHAVQFYGANDRELILSASRYLADGLKSGDGVLIIATAKHNQSFAEELTNLGVPPQPAAQQRRLVFLDAEVMLRSVLVEDRVDSTLFERTVVSALRDIRARRRPHHTGIRVYGELVALLWQSGLMSTAIQLEHYWNRLKDTIAFDLFCGYPIVRSNDSDVRAIVCAHTHVVSGTAVGALAVAAREQDTPGALASETP